MKSLFVIITATLILTACSANSNFEGFENEAYLQWLDKKSAVIKKDNTYAPLPIETEEQEMAFFKFTYQLYKHKISKITFSKALLKSYPGYTKSINKLTNTL